MRATKTTTDIWYSYHAFPHLNIDATCNTYYTLKKLSLKYKNNKNLRFKAEKQVTLSLFCFLRFLQEAFAQALIGHPTIQAVMDAAENST
jgi:hypothetical protein